MNDTPEIEAARNATLQKIGRNVVNLGKMEGMLKYLVTFSKLSATSSDFAAYLKRRTTKVSRMTMGALVEEASKGLFAPSATPGETPDMFEIEVSHSFSMEGTDEQFAAWRTEMKFIVEQRNTLMHETLAKFNPDAIESCKEISAQLDEQRERMLPLYQWLQAMVMAHREALKEAPRDAPGRDVLEGEI